ncbi:MULTISPECIES: protein-methionine-sulfoxide reductase catalytic subunit MsrP [unclassified Halomonas]|uniref:protein-methionine-sulfoxide reductase catalytic subunit MsrP n=1 Tax=unclassified Halomonas TaxID=2609666 RepID=UPI00209E5F86|nr:MULTISPECIES: protein-methionine-sulfoxide reductase catalytic subunit MsrP [unclassified Halomonas]MCP1315297.1 protein-methionine-sulfoxide reductase catalytic subunit MsrP [Halomonas sp. 707D7]MCP1328374.1 protein-methionine-sulfoxide reductase catalytic subunit MsrP [Halomonas sp. 707D4]
MLIKIAKPSDLRESDVTPESVYLSRRRFLGGVAGVGAGLMLSGRVKASEDYSDVPSGNAPAWLDDKIRQTQWRAVTPADPEKDTLAPFEDASGYNNFYEFGTGKSDPAKRAGSLQTEPWSVVVDGEVNNGGRFTLEDFASPSQFEERIYRLRCVEAWSMVIPWLGIPLGEVIRRADPTSKAKYVRFETLVDPEQMPGQRSSFALIDWPYVEGLRLDEAMHPLTLLALGMYGRELPNQNGAPLRLVVPWKYGFKSIKSIVRISLVEEQPVNSWQLLAPDEYGFYANVNPDVDHPRWSQATERRLPNSLFSPNNIDTRMFNGYADEVAELYAGMDLAVNY